MCLAIPVQVLELNPDTGMAVVALEGVKKEISVALLEEVAVGDYVLVHVGYALNRISVEEAQKTLALMAEAGLVAADEAGGAA